MTTNHTNTRPTQLPPPPPPSAPGGAALPLPTAEQPPTHAHWAPKGGEWAHFEGFPPGHIHTPTGWPLVPALVAPLHPTPLPRNRWARAAWNWSPDDPRLVGCLSDLLLDRHDEARAA